MSSKKIFVAWTRISRRSQQLSREFDAEFYRLDRVDANSILIIFRLMKNSILTFIKFIKTKPDIIFTFHAHPIITLVGYVYKTLFCCKLVPDLHTAAYMNYNCFPYNILNRFLWIRSNVVLVHNSNSYLYLIKKIPKLKNNLFILEDPIPSFEKIFSTPNFLKDKALFSAVFICRFAADEPFQEFINAAHRISNTTFYITGNYKRSSLSKSELQKSNIHLTGFLSDSEYVHLISSVDFIIVLTTRDYTLLSGGYEALAFSKPIITSDKATLRDYFGENAIYVSNDPNSIATGIEKMLNHISQYKIRIEYLKKEKVEIWNKKKSQLLYKIEKE